MIIFKGVGGMFDKLLTDDKLFSLLKDAKMVGYSINLNYSSMTILTNDYYKRECSGIPHNSFLIATSIDLKNLGRTQEVDEEIILLRVTSEYELPNSDVWLEAKIDKFKNVQSDTPLNYDEYSQNELQYSGLECRVLGTFFKDDKGQLVFGSDIENFYGTQILRIYKPSPLNLETIINYKSNHGISVNLARSGKEVGAIRFTSSNRMQSKENKAKVYIDPMDFVARRTAMFGMTRTGKSNTVKTLIKAISETANEKGMKIGQIIYDINGEYANINIDDKGSIAEDIKSAQVFTLNTKIKDKENIEILQFDFFENLRLAHEIIIGLLQASGSQKSTDMEAFANMDIGFYLPENIDLNDRSMINRAEWLRAIYKYILYKSIGDRNPGNIKIPFSKAILKQIEEEELADKHISYEQLGNVLEKIHGERENLKTSTGKKVYQDDLATLVNIAVKKNSNGGPFLGYGHIQKLGAGDYHSKGRKNYIDKISNLVRDGKTIILDLAIGSEEMRNLISDKIARKIFNNNMAMYTEGKEPDYVIFYIEEAHNLIGKDMDLKDTWPRIAKEGAKYKIGLAYSTQEPSSINKNILSNTENWFVTHLNNEDELRTLSKFYDFVDFKNSLLRSKDVGFARVKTLSHNFVLPVQIKLYESGE